MGNAKAKLYEAVGYSIKDALRSLHELVSYYYPGIKRWIRTKERTDGDGSPITIFTTTREQRLNITFSSKKGRAHCRTVHLAQSSGAHVYL